MIVPAMMQLLQLYHKSNAEKITMQMIIQGVVLWQLIFFKSYTNRSVSISFISQEKGGRLSNRNIMPQLEAL